MLDDQRIQEINAIEKKLDAFGSSCVSFGHADNGSMEEDRHARYSSELRGEILKLVNDLRSAEQGGWIAVETGLPRDGSDVFAAIWWTNTEDASKSSYEIHDCDYYEGGAGSHQQKIFADCEGNEFEAAEVSFWIYKSDLIKNLAPPAAPKKENA